MKAVYLDCFAGISGNMLLGAFLQAGVPTAYLERELGKLPVGDEFELSIEDVDKNGIRAVYAEVKPKEEAESHRHRSFTDIRDLILRSTLSGEVKRNSIAVFEELAAAEAKIHGKTMEEVTFHEVGAVDSIVDIVGAAICLDYLEIEAVFASKVNVGSGFVKCAHGLMPVPAPAAAELLKGLPFYQRGDERELTTPTGAALLKTVATFADNLPPDFVIERIAYGAGTWELDIPNVIRLYFGEWQGEKERQLYLLETNIDDMNPQVYGYLYERLAAAGALDVWVTDVHMKKNRPGEMLTILTDEAHRDDCADIVFTETTSIGLRVMPVASRIEADRHLAKVSTEHGDVAVKVSAYRGKIVSLSAEYEDCCRIARESGLPLKKVQQAAVQEMSRRLGE